MRQVLEGGRVRKVVDEQKGIGREVGGGPKGAVFFLASCVGKIEMVGEAVYGACYGVRIFDGRVVSDRCKI